MKSTRDHRIDVLRGLCLLIILIDHSRDFLVGLGSLSPRYFLPTLRDVGLITGLEVFVFLSGYVFGAVYATMLDTGGFVACQKRAFDRVLQIYRANVITFAVVLGLVALLPIANAAFPRLSTLDLLAQDPFRMTLSFLTLQYGPFYTGILFKFYLLLLAAPAMLVLFRAAPLAAVGLSFGLYALGQARPEIGMPWHDGSRWDTNILAYQFLFFVAMVMGSRQWLRTVVLSPRDLRFWAAGAALIVVCGLLVVGRWHERFGVPPFTMPWTGRDNLEPFRLLYVIVAIPFLVALVPTGDRIQGMRLFAPAAVCGRQSLEAFCVSILVTYGIVWAVATTNTGFAGYLAALVPGVTLVWLGALWLDGKKKSGRTPVPRTAAVTETSRPVLPSAAVGAGAVSSGR